MRESERVARRVILWSLVAAGLGAGFGYLRIGFAPKDVVEIFGATLAFLGLVVAAATVQYGVWRQSARSTYDDLKDVVGAVARHNRIALSNYVFIGLALLVSCVLDALVLLAPDDVVGGAT